MIYPAYEEMSVYACITANALKILTVKIWRIKLIV